MTAGKKPNHSCKVFLIDAKNCMKRNLLISYWNLGIFIFDIKIYLDIINLPMTVPLLYIGTASSVHIDIPIVDISQINAILV